MVVTSYYKQKTELIESIGDMINKHKGKKVKLSTIEDEALKKYGFGKKVIENILDMYSRQGLILIYKSYDEVEIL